MKYLLFFIFSTFSFAYSLADVDSNRTIVISNDKAIKILFPKAQHKERNTLSLDDAYTHNLVFFDATYTRRFIKEFNTFDTHSLFQMAKNPWNPAFSITLFNKKKLITHRSSLHLYKNKSEVKFYENIIITKDAIPDIKNTKKDSYVLRKPVNDTLKGLIKQIQSDKIIYIGEHHNQLKHHENQLRIISSLYAKNPNIIIAMEMFFIPFQDVIDDYIDAKIDEETFLKKTEYQKRWGFKWAYYKPILDFAKKYHIRVIATNLPKEIVRQNTQKGFFKLDDNTTNSLPQQIDFSKQRYQKNLNEQFSNMGKHMKGKVKNYISSQILWDETMAESIHKTYLAYPSYQIIMLVGSGHLSKDGIPPRVYTRNYQSYSVISQDKAFDLYDGSDYIILNDR